MPPLAERIPFEERILEVRRGLARWQQTLAERCSGPHVYVRHQVGKPPYCQHCRFTDVGLHLSEYGTGKPDREADPDDGEED